MTKSANDNIMTSLHLITLMLVGLPAWRKTAEFDISVFLQSPCMYMLVIEHNRYTHTGAQKLCRPLHYASYASA